MALEHNGKKQTQELFVTAAFLVFSLSLPLTT